MEYNIGTLPSKCCIENNSHKQKVLLIVVIMQQIYCLENRIVGGIEADIEQFPWLAQITLMRHHHCGGVIVSTRTIVTAAHCICMESDQLIPVKYLQVHVGASETNKGAKHKTCVTKPHPLYMTLEYDYFYDIALMLLKTNIEFNTRVKKANIVPNYSWQTENTTVVVAGYGAIDNDRNPSDTIRMTTMRYVDSKRCNESQTSDGEPMPVPDHMFCLVGDWFTSDCFGDSGSGVIWDEIVIGIVNLGRDEICGSEAMPSMYTDLAYFNEWITENTDRLESLTSGKCKKPVKDTTANELRTDYSYLSVIFDFLKRKSKCFR